MDLSVLNQVPYVMDAFAKWTQESPQSVMLVDDQYYKGWTRQRVNEESACVYAYLKQRGIGREDFVMVCLPRGVLPMVAMIGGSVNVCALHPASLATPLNGALHVFAYKFSYVFSHGK